MPRCSNTVVGILNIFVFLLSVPVLWMGIYLSVHGSTQCAKFLDKPMILLGVFLMVVSIAGIVGSWCKVQWLMWVYLVLMFILILLFFSYTIFAFVISGKGAGENIPGKAYKEYRLGSYSKWLQNHVKHNKDWKNFRSCLFDSKFCPQMEKDYGRDNVSAFNKRALGPLDSGCCKPSNDCNFTYITPTQWNKTSSGSQKNSDCQLWDNDSKKLCYDCKACKAGFVDSIKNTLKSVAVGNIFILLFLIALHVMGFYAARNNKEEKDFNQI